MSEDRKNEIMLLATEAALFFGTLVEKGVPAIHASALTGNWILSQRIKDATEGEDWKGES